MYTQLEHPRNEIVYNTLDLLITVREKYMLSLLQ